MPNENRFVGVLIDGFEEYSNYISTLDKNVID